MLRPAITRMIVPSTTTTKMATATQNRPTSQASCSSE